MTQHCDLPPVELKNILVHDFDLLHSEVEYAITQHHEVPPAEKEDDMTQQHEFPPFTKADDPATSPRYVSSEVSKQASPAMC